MNGNDWFHIFKCIHQFWQVRNRQIALSLFNVNLNKLVSKQIADDAIAPKCIGCHFC